MEKGYEDIYRPQPYIETEIDRDRLIVTMLYVPPELRGQGLGTQLVNQLIAEVPTSVKVILLLACSLGSGDTLQFWQRFGFVPVYSGDLSKTGNVLNLPVNGWPAPPVEVLPVGEERHYILD